MELPKRKSNRLSDYSYSQHGCYFLTLCSINKLPLFCRIKEGTVSEPPTIQLSNYGTIVEKQLQSMQDIYADIHIEKYVIMPNHIHLLIFIRQSDSSSQPANDRIPSLISTLKRFTNKTAGVTLWQRSYYDHVIRDESDFLTRWKYIDDNPAKWMLDRFYVSER